MKLSEMLESCHNSGDFGRGLEGYAEKAKQLEDALQDTLLFLEQHSNRWDGVNGKHPNDVAINARALLEIVDA